MLIAKKPLFDGVQKIYRFPNGYGASVVRHAYSYGGSSGLWELGVIKFTSPDSGEWRLTYETPVTDDVIPRMRANEIEEYLQQIEAL